MSVSIGEPMRTEEGKDVNPQLTSTHVYV